MITDAGALHGVRILDFTNLLAGPFPSLLCGFLGAQVIKVESWAQLDAARRTPYAQDNPDNSPAFNSINVNKLSVQLNLKEPKAVKLVHHLTAISDVVVENMRPGVMDRLGLGYQQLSRINSGTPAVIDRWTPDLGENNLDVFQGILGLNKAEVERLQEAKIIW